MPFVKAAVTPVTGNGPGRVLMIIRRGVALKRLRRRAHLIHRARRRPIPRPMTNDRRWARKNTRTATPGMSHAASVLLSVLGGGPVLLSVSPTSPKTEFCSSTQRAGLARRAGLRSNESHAQRPCAQKDTSVRKTHAFKINATTSRLKLIKIVSKN